MCTLDASKDYEAISAWLALQESTETERAYRKEAERLLLWAILVQLKLLQRLGYFPMLTDVPVAVIEHIGAAL